MAQHHSLDGCLGLVHPFELRHRVDDAGIQHLAGWVNNSKFAAHAVAGVKPEHDLAGDRRLEQKLAQVIAKDRNCAFIGPRSQRGAQFIFKARVDQAGVGVAGRGFHQQRAGAAGLFAGKHPGCDRRRALGINHN